MGPSKKNIGQATRGCIACPRRIRWGGSDAEDKNKTVGKKGMSMKRKILILILFFLSVVLVLGGPFFPSMVYELIYMYKPQFQDIRFPNIIPCFRVCGLVLSGWGIAIFLKKTN